jgi:hypothetical protein
MERFYLQVDGKSFLPLLKGVSGSGTGHEFLRHYCGNDLQALRYVDTGTYPTILNVKNSNNFLEKTS